MSSTQRSVRALNHPYRWNELNLLLTDRYNAGVLDNPLQVDSNLSYDEHVTQTVSSRIGSLCQINRVKHLFDVKTLERVINALVFS